MARIINYGREDIPDENDLLIGTDAQTKKSKNFVLGNLKLFFNEGESNQQTFETVSKNLRQYPYTIEYQLGNLDKIVYATPSGIITKTFVYLANKLDQIILSGEIDGLTENTKKFNYTDNKLTSINYY